LLPGHHPSSLYTFLSETKGDDSIDNVMIEVLQMIMAAFLLPLASAGSM
jgi:hypothetical protein